MTSELLSDTDREEAAQKASDRAAEIARIRELATFLETTPSVSLGAQRFLLYVFTREELATIARVGRWEKVPEGDYYTLRKTFSGGTTLDVYTDRDKVCRKVVTGQRTVEAKPAVEAHTEDIEEWICEDARLLGTR